MANELIFEYEDILIGKRKTYSSFYFCYTDEGNEKQALIIFRYAFDTYLRWTPEELYHNLTPEILSRLKLTPLLKYIRYPGEADKRYDVYPVVAKLYPGRFHEDTKDIVMRMYDKVMSKQRNKFPNDFFTGNEGRQRALYCLQYALNKCPPFKNVREIYEVFASPQADMKLKKWNLYNVCYKIFSTPLDYIHEAMPKTLRSEFWYKYHKFIKEIERKSSSK